MLIGSAWGTMLAVGAAIGGLAYGATRIFGTGALGPVVVSLCAATDDPLGLDRAQYERDPRSVDPVALPSFRSVRDRRCPKRSAASRPA